MSITENIAKDSIDSATSIINNGLKYNPIALIAIILVLALLGIVAGFGSLAYISFTTMQDQNKILEKSSDTQEKATLKLSESMEKNNAKLDSMNQNFKYYFFNNRKKGVVGYDDK